MDDVQYDKRFTNRNRIINPNGWTWITVPINKEHKFAQNKDVKINNEIPWREIHLKKILHAYSNAKFFHIYKDFFEKIYKKEWEFLFDLNFETIKKTFDFLGIKIEIILESELNVTGTSTERLVNVCKKIGADTYISGIGGKNYIEDSVFEKNNVKLVYQNYKYQEYKQHLATSFVPDLSIIDMLTNVGPDTLRTIMN